MLSALLLSASLALAASVQLTTADGVKIHAESFGSGANGVVLVHGKGGSRSDWSTLSAKLSSAGFQVLAVDLRGHGESASGALQEADYLKMTADVDAAAAWLTAHGATSVAAVGAELGANLALNAAANNPTIQNLLLLSPGLNHEGVKVGSAVTSYGKRPLLLVAGAGDLMASKAATILESRATGPRLVELPDTSARGHQLLHSAPDVEALLLSWLNGSFSDVGDPGSGRPDIGTAASDGIETTGTRLEDRR
ncbi:MAG: pimeloyl-ACP methyl ester carboxylesterase [Myxococcota bacterium]|jgi:pimeloyl-ACP methyl ester carboxylesterase